jgi:hypothetical protein
MFLWIFTLQSASPEDPCYHGVIVNVRSTFRVVHFKLRLATFKLLTAATSNIASAPC